MTGVQRWRVTDTAELRSDTTQHHQQRMLLNQANAVTVAFLAKPSTETSSPLLPSLSCASLHRTKELMPQQLLVTIKLYATE
jgi:hypothetical protein